MGRAGMSRTGLGWAGAGRPTAWGVTLEDREDSTSSAVLCDPSSGPPSLCLGLCPTWPRRSCGSSWRFPASSLSKPTKEKSGLPGAVR